MSHRSLQLTDSLAICYCPRSGDCSIGYSLPWAYGARRRSPAAGFFISAPRCHSFLKKIQCVADAAVSRVRDGGAQGPKPIACLLWGAVERAVAVRRLGPWVPTFFSAERATNND